MPWKPEFWTITLNRIAGDLLDWLPRLAAVFLLLVGGWAAARIAQALISGLLHRLGFDHLAERVGAARALRDVGIESSLSRLIARAVYWLILLVFFFAAIESLGVGGIMETLRGLVGYLPRVLAAALILLAGSLVARLVGNALGTLAAQSGIRGGTAVGRLTQYVVLVFVIILAVEQLGVETTLLVTTATALIASAALALAIAFGWGSRVLARNIMAGYHARDQFTPGQRLRVRDQIGQLIGIGPVKTLLQTEEGILSLPNSVMTEEEVVILSSREPEE